MRVMSFYGDVYERWIDRAHKGTRNLVMGSYDRQFEVLYGTGGQKEVPSLRHEQNSTDRDIAIRVKYLDDNRVPPLAEALLPRIERLLGSIA